MEDMQPKSTNKKTGLKRFLAQSDYITVAWNWFLILAGKAAEPVLVVSVLYASVKLLPMVHFPAQCDVVVFIAQFVALDIGGLSLNKLADQAKKDGNADGADQAKKLSIALVCILLVGVIMAGVDQVVHLDSQIATIVDTILLIARAIMAILYSRVIHSLRKDEPEPLIETADLETLIAEIVNAVIAETLITVRQEITTQVEQILSQRTEEHVVPETMPTVTPETVMAMIEAAFQKRKRLSSTVQTKQTQHITSIAEAAATRRQSSKVPVGKKIDQIIWPLLHTGMTIRAIAIQAHTSTATVGRSRQRWIAAQDLAVSQRETPTVISSYDRGAETEERLVTVRQEIQ
jgi:hypothetical protein